MRAALYQGSGERDVIAVRDVPDPIVGTDDALVRVAYAGLNRADILERQGKYAAPRADVTIPGLEFSGVVAAVGARVTNVAPGDRVCGLVQTGAHAELVALQALTLAKLPDGIDLRAAAAIPEAFITAHDALFSRARFGLGEYALVHAVGSSVGLAAVGLIKRAGGIALGTSRTVDKLERAASHGLASGFVLDDEWPALVQAAAGGRGADVILDFVGAPMLERNLRALAERGRIVQIGAMGGANATLPLGLLIAKRAELHGTMLRMRPLEEKIALAKHLQRALLPLFVRGDLRTEIDSVFPLDDLAGAHERMESNANFGKIVLAVDPAA